MCLMEAFKQLVPTRGLRRQQEAGAMDDGLFIPLTLMPGLMRKNWDMVRFAAFQMVGQLSPCTTWYH